MEEGFDDAGLGQFFQVAARFAQTQAAEADFADREFVAYQMVERHVGTSRLRRDWAGSIATS